MILSHEMKLAQRSQATTILYQTTPNINVGRV